MLISVPSFTSLALASSLLVGVCTGCSSSGATGTPGASTAGSAGSSASLGDPSGTVDCAAEPNVDTYAAGLKKASVSGAFEFELVSSAPAPPALNDNTFMVRVTAADGSPVGVGGQLSATLDMPEHGHMSPKTPVITFDTATSTFTLDPMYFFMVGLWRVTLTFSPAAESEAAAGASNSPSPTDSVELRFCVD
jgi:hypothetical protein